MANYTLKKCRRCDPLNSTVLELTGEWIVRAADDGAAQNQAGGVLGALHIHEYALLLNNNGKMVWEGQHHA